MKLISVMISRNQIVFCEVFCFLLLVPFIGSSSWIGRGYKVRGLMGGFSLQKSNRFLKVFLEK